MIETYANGRALADAAAAGVIVKLRDGLRTHGRACLVGTGGRSPAPVYDRLNDPHVDWARVVVTLSDERCVPDDAPESNARLTKEHLLTGERAKAHFVPLWPKPESAALQHLMPFDAVILGMGEDGHIASLIPGDPDLPRHLDPKGEALIVDVPAGLGSPPLPRVSLTLKALLATRAIFLLIAGGAKREVVERALGGEDLPVRAVLTPGAPTRVLWTP